MDAKRLERSFGWADGNFYLLQLEMRSHKAAIKWSATFQPAKLE